MAVDKEKLKVEFFWHGLKRINGGEDHYVLPKADYYVDCRVIPEKGILGMSGTDPSFLAGVMEKAPFTIRNICALVEEAADLILARRNDLVDPYSKPFRVCFYCAYAIHRSRAGCTLVAERLRKKGYNITTPPKEQHYYKAKAHQENTHPVVNKLT